jgi:hypothetical protein
MAVRIQCLCIDTSDPDGNEFDVLQPLAHA